MHFRLLRMNEKLLVVLLAVFLITMLIAFRSGIGQLVIGAIVVLVVALFLSLTLKVIVVSQGEPKPSSPQESESLSPTLAGTLSVVAGMVTLIELEFLGLSAILVAVAASILVFVLLHIWSGPESEHWN